MRLSAIGTSIARNRRPPPTVAGERQIGARRALAAESGDNASYQDCWGMAPRGAERWRSRYRIRNSWIHFTSYSVRLVERTAA